MCYVRKTKLLMELWYNKLHALIHISNKEAEYQYPGQRTSMSEKFRRRFLRDRDNGNGPWRIKNFPSVESEGHNTLEERTVSTDRHAKETSVRQKRAEVFRKLQVSSQEIRLNKKSEPNWEVFFFFFPSANWEVFYSMLRSLDFLLAQWFQAETWHASICISDR